MTCQDAREQLSDWLDEALGREAAGALAAHLEACAECRRELERFRRTVALLRSVEPARAPAGFVDRVLAAARPEPWPRRLLRRLFAPPSIKVPLEAAAVLLVAVTAVYLYRATPEVRRAGEFATSSSAPASRAPEGPAQAPSASTPPTVTPSLASPPSAPAPPPASAGGPAPEPSAPAPAPAAPAPLAKKAEAPPVASPESSATGSVTAPRPDIGRQATGAPRPQVAERPAELHSSATKEGDVVARDRPPAAGAPDATRQEQAKMRQASPLAAAPPATEGAREEKPPSPPGVHRFSARALVSVDVSGRLVVEDREAARLRLEQLVARLGGTPLARRPDPGAPAVELVEIVLPRGAYAEFVGELGRLGRWLPEREVLESAEHVRIVVRITD